jgi:hypothetical protein
MEDISMGQREVALIMGQKQASVTQSIYYWRYT